MLRQGKLTNSAILAFGSNPQFYFPSATIKCAYSHNLAMVKPISDYKEFGGTVFQMADAAIDFVLSKISIALGDRSRSNQAETNYEIPRAVIAEALINAIRSSMCSSRSKKHSSLLLWSKKFISVHPKSFFLYIIYKISRILKNRQVLY